jgi:hypothetical protein
LSFDLDDAIRATRPQRPSFPLQRRPDGQLVWALGEPLIGVPLFLDTTVFLDQLTPGGRIIFYNGAAAS